MEPSLEVNPVIVIPVYNGRDSLLHLISQIKSACNYPMIIVDDGSTDSLMASDLKDQHYLQHSTNRGKGAALKSGLNLAREMGYSCAVTLDADGQHDPGLIVTFVASFRDNKHNLVVGMRDLLKQDMPFHRKLSNNITSLMLSFRAGFRIYDSQVGYRCYPLNDSRLWDSSEDGFQFESAVFFNAAKLNIKPYWQPIPVIYGTEDSHMDLFWDTLRFIRTYLRSFKW